MRPPTALTALLAVAAASCSSGSGGARYGADVEIGAPLPERRGEAARPDEPGSGDGERASREADAEAPPAVALPGDGEDAGRSRRGGGAAAPHVPDAWPAGDATGGSPGRRPAPFPLPSEQPDRSAPDAETSTEGEGSGGAAPPKPAPLPPTGAGDADAAGSAPTDDVDGPDVAPIGGPGASPEDASASPPSGPGADGAGGVPAPEAPWLVVLPPPSTWPSAPEPGGGASAGDDPDAVGGTPPADAASADAAGAPDSASPDAVAGAPDAGAAAGDGAEAGGNAGGAGPTADVGPDAPPPGDEPVPPPPPGDEPVPPPPPGDEPVPPPPPGDEPVPPPPPGADAVGAEPDAGSEGDAADGAPGCEPGARRCAANAVQSCNDAGQWTWVADCTADDAVCEAGACVATAGSGALCDGASCVGQDLGSALCAIEACGAAAPADAALVSPTGDELAPAWRALAHYGDPGNDLEPTAGGSYLLLSTGIAEAQPEHQANLEGAGTAWDPYAAQDPERMHDAIELRLEMTAPADATGFALDVLFMSTEYHEWVGTEFNDTFYLVLEAPETTGGEPVVVNHTQCADPDGYADFEQDGEPRCYVAINSSYSEACPDAPTSLAGTGYGCDGTAQATEGGSSTGWLTTRWPLEPGEPFTLTLHLHDTADPLYDSAVLVDHFRWTSEPVEPGTALTEGL